MARIQRSGILAAVFFLALLGAAESIAGTRGAYRRGGQRRAVPDHVVAYAALDALDNQAGWGRFVVRDLSLPSGEERAVKVSLYGLEPNARYSVEADGIEVGTVFTDSKGDGSLELRTRGRGLSNVPSDLPGADEVFEASVFNAWRTMVLDGLFTIVREHVTDPTVHREKIHLESEEDLDVMGMAAVCRKESGAQGFATMASGLEPGLQYSVVVDGIEVGVVTADEEGQAGLELHDPSDENPLPDALQPVENIREVQWFQGELLLLWGVFSGESEDRCHEFEGWFAGLTDNGFVLRKGDHELEVVVTDETEFEGFDELSQLEEGDWLEVKACWDGEQLFARWVELEEHERECMELEGIFVRATEEGFLLRKGDHELEVIVTDDTEFEGFDHLEDLEEGDWLEVEGCWDGEFFFASSVELEETELECFKVRGEVIELIGDGFVLRVEEESVTVLVTEETTFYGFETLEDLDEGDLVTVYACFDGEMVTARWVKLIEGDDCVELRGVVVEVWDSGFVIKKGDDTVQVAVTAETELKGFDSIDQLDDGDVVVLEGCFNSDVLVAAWVCLVEDDDCAELHGVVAEVRDFSFVLQVGDDFVEVAVNSETELKGFESIAQLDSGDAVAVEGCFDGEVLVAAWVCLVEDDDCVELHGVVLERDGDQLWVQVGEEIVEVVVTDETWFKEFESLDELDGGEVVLIEGCFDGEVLVAKWIKLLEDDDQPEWWEVDGTVVGFLENGFVLSADGETVNVILTEETELVGYDNADQIAEGDVVFAEGLCDGENLHAKRVELIEHGA